MTTQLIHYGRKRSGIKKELRTKIKSWLESIDDEAVRELAKKNTIVTGGAIASMLLGEKVNDFDVYFRDKATTLAVVKYYAIRFGAENPRFQKPEVREETLINIKGAEEDRVTLFISSDGVAEEDEKKKKERTPYRPVFLSQNAITLSDKFQIVIRFYGEPDEIHDNYDFVHAKCYWDHGNDVLHLPAESLECLLSRTLVYSGSLYPIASIFRMKKFIERGWRISAGQQLKIMWQISEIDMTDASTLTEQLTGVDQAYMHALINALAGVKPENMCSDYVGEVIDRIFE